MSRFQEDFAETPTLEPGTSSNSKPSTRRVATPRVERRYIRRILRADAEWVVSHSPSPLHLTGSTGIVGNPVNGLSESIVNRNAWRIVAPSAGLSRAFGETCLPRFARPKGAASRRFNWETFRVYDGRFLMKRWNTAMHGRISTIDPTSLPERPPAVGRRTASRRPRLVAIRNQATTLAGHILDPAATGASAPGSTPTPASGRRAPRRHPASIWDAAMVARPPGCRPPTRLGFHVHEKPFADSLGTPAREVATCFFTVTSTVEIVRRKPRHLRRSASPSRPRRVDGALHRLDSGRQGRRTGRTTSVAAASRFIMGTSRCVLKEYFRHAPRTRQIGPSRAETFANRF